MPRINPYIPARWQRLLSTSALPVAARHSPAPLLWPTPPLPPPPPPASERRRGAATPPEVGVKPRAAHGIAAAHKAAQTRKRMTAHVSTLLAMGVDTCLIDEGKRARRQAHATGASGEGRTAKQGTALRRGQGTRGRRAIAADNRTRGRRTMSRPSHAMQARPSTAPLRALASPALGTPGGTRSPRGRTISWSILDAIALTKLGLGRNSAPSGRARADRLRTWSFGGQRRRRHCFSPTPEHCGTTPDQLLAEGTQTSGPTGPHPPTGSGWNPPDAGPPCTPRKCAGPTPPLNRRTPIAVRSCASYCLISAHTVFSGWQRLGRKSLPPPMPAAL